MATITKPMALDESFNTTETTPRSQADVLAAIESAIRQGFGQVANAVSYDNTDSGLTADNVQDAIDEVDDTVDGLVDDVAEISSDIESTQTATGNPITLTDAAPINAESLVVELEPKQDLHGQSAPYVGGAGKNKIDTSADSDFYIGHYYVGVNGSMSEDNNFDAFRCEINGDTTYTLSNNLGTELSGSGGIIRFENADKSLNSVNVSGFSHTSATFEPPTNAVYMVVCINNTLGVMLQLEVGSQVTSYASYSNICPITGYTECEVDDVGKNILEPTAQTQTINQVIFTKNSDGTYTVNGTASEATFFYPCGQYASFDMNGKTISGCPSGGSTGSYWFSFSNSTEAEFDTGNGAAVTREVSGAPVFVMLQGASLNNAVLKPMICSSSAENPTAYEPCHSSNATIQFGQTVYGGRSNFTDGGTSDEFENVDLGDLSWTYRGDGLFSADLSDYAFESDVMAYCSGYRYIGTVDGASMATSNGSVYLYYNDGQSSRVIYVVDTQYADAIVFKAAVTGIQFVYEKVTHDTISTPPTELKLLKGTNNITTNGATITLGYQPDNVIGEVKVEIEKCSPNPEFMHFEVNENVVDAIPIIFDEAIHSYTVSGDNWKDKTFLCVECCDMRYGILQRVLSSDMAFVDSCGKALMLYPYMRSIEQYIKITISLGQSYGYEISYQTTNTSSPLDYLKIRVRLFN